MPKTIPVAKPVEIPVAQPAPPAGRKFPCPSCGARLDFNPAVRGMKCPFCGYEQKIDAGDAADIAERDFNDYLDREEGTGQAIPGRSTEVRCTGCGAMVLLEDKVETDKCPFCATHLENKPEAAHAMIPPESLLPFRLDLRQARDAFEIWLHALWFAPTELKRIAALGQLAGIYIPFWTYDAMTYTDYTGERGIDTTTYQQYTDTDANGNRVTRTRTVVVTNWTPVSGEVRHFFDDVLICGSTSLPGDLIDDLGKWDLKKLEPFRAEYLSSFKTERYAVGLKDGYKRSKTIMKGVIDQLVRRDIGGHHQRVRSQESKFSAVTFKPLLLPVWVAVYRYHEKTFQFLVNGRSGRVTGYRPWSRWKIARLVALILLAVILVIVLVKATGK